MPRKLGKFGQKIHKNFCMSNLFNYSEKLFFSLPILGMKGHKYSICQNEPGVMKVFGGKFTPTV